MLVLTGEAKEGFSGDSRRLGGGRGAGEEGGTSLEIRLDAGEPARPMASFETTRATGFLSGTGVGPWTCLNRASIASRSFRPTLA